MKIARYLLLYVVLISFLGGLMASNVSKRGLIYVYTKNGNVCRAYSTAEYEACVSGTNLVSAYTTNIRPVSTTQTTNPTLCTLRITICAE